MKLTWPLALCALLSAVLAAFAGEREADAEQAALAWLSLVDSGQYESSWQDAATLFKEQITAQQWAQAVASARKPLGAFRSRRLTSATYTTTLPGAPDGEYVVLQFEAIYEKKASAVETVTPMLDAGVWRVSGYFIR